MSCEGICEGKSPIVNYKVGNQWMQVGVKEENTLLPMRKVHLPLLRTRTSPRLLYDCIKELNSDQQQVVRDMGLGSVLKVKMDEIPQKLGFWLVDKLDTS